MYHNQLRNLCFFISISMSFSCQNTDFENVCDPKSKGYLESFLIRFINFDETPHCGVVLKVLPPTYLVCPALIPKPNGSFFLESFETDGNRLSFSSNPALPNGISFSLFSNSLQGIYSGWKANRQSFTITATNPKGSASCTYNPAWMGKLPSKTNVTTCYDGSGNIDPTCTAIPGQDGQFQKGLVKNFVGPSFIATDQITIDFNTGLVWTSCQIGKAGAGCPSVSATTFDLTSAQTECANLNIGSGYANRTDWRVPEIDEYLSTFDYTLANPSIDQVYFPATDSFNFKTNTNYSSGSSAFYPTFIESSIGAGNYTDAHHLRCVSNYIPPKNKRLQNNNDGTVLDLDTSLVWQKCTAGQTNLTTCTGGTDLITDWIGSINYCQSLNLAGKIWRLPNVTELRSLLDFYTNNGVPGFDLTYFPNTASSSYWTSTTGPLPSSPKTNAYVVEFGTSSGGPGAKSNNTTNRTRCVSDF